MNNDAQVAKVVNKTRGNENLEEESFRKASEDCPRGRFRCDDYLVKKP